MNIINCVSARIQYLQEKGAELHQSTHRTVYTSALESKSMKKNCTTAFYIVAASIMCSFDHLFHNKKGRQNEKRVRAGSEKPLITMAIAGSIISTCNVKYVAVALCRTYMCGPIMKPSLEKVSASLVI